MKYIAPSYFKVAYCLAILTTVLPVSLARLNFGNLTMGLGSAGLVFLLPLLFKISVGIYRVFLVAKIKGTLNSFTVTGFAKVLRKIGVFCIYVGAAVGVYSWLSFLMGDEKLISAIQWGLFLGLYITSITGMGFAMIGVFLFELSRLVAFENNAKTTDDNALDLKVT
jgi:hypothetical protein